MSLPRVIVCHGARGGPDTNWFPWLAAQLSERGIEVQRPHFPTPQGQSLAAWFDVYGAAIGSLPPKSTILVGHSLGATMALRVVERAAVPFSALFLAAGFIGALNLPDYDPVNASFFSQPFDWPGIRQRMGTCRCWAGDDDPYVPLPRSQEMAGHLHAPLDVISGAGHLNSETGFMAFPQMRDAILWTAGERVGHGSSSLSSGSE